MVCNRHINGQIFSWFGSRHTDLLYSVSFRKPISRSTIVGSRGVQQGPGDRFLISDGKSTDECIHLCTQTVSGDRHNIPGDGCIFLHEKWVFPCNRHIFLDNKHQAQQLSGVSDDRYMSGGIHNLNDSEYRLQFTMPGAMQGVPVDRQGVPSVSLCDISPGDRQVMPGDRHGVPVVRQGVPGDRQGLPSNRQGAPGVRQEVPGDRHAMPGDRHGGPGVRQGVPGDR